MPSRISSVSSSVGASTWIDWKRRSSERSFSMYLRYSFSVVAPMQEISPRDSAGLRMLAASSEPSAEPAPISEWISSMKTISSRASLSSFKIPFRRSSNWPRYLVPATISDRSRAMIRLLARKIGTLPSTMRSARPSTMAVLPTPGSPSRMGLFLVRRERIWMMRSTSTSRPISGSKPPSAASVVRSRPYSVRNGSSFFCCDASRSLAMVSTSSRTV